MKKSLNCLVLVCLVLCGTIDLSAQKKIVVRPKEIDDVLINPGKGFTTFHCFNGNYAGSSKTGYPGVGGGYIPDCYFEPVTYKFDSNLVNKDYPQSSVAYFRINWSFIEPKEDEYNWKFIDSLLVTGEKRNQRLLFRISPYSGLIGSSYQNGDVPSWFQEKIGPTDKAAIPNSWRIDHNNPLYLKYFGKLISAFGRRFDGHPMIEAVDLAICGNAGEGVGSNFLEEGVRNGLVKAYTESFKKTQLIVMGRTDKTEQNVYHLCKEDGVDVGWRLDCLGGVLGPGGNYSLMDDYYPQAIEQGMKAHDVWQKDPIAFEACWTMQHWKEKGWDVNYMIDQSLKWHISTFNNKSSPVPEEWRPAVERWIKSMGYRFVLRRFSYPESIRANEMLHYESWWENKGVAPIYNKNFLLAIRLTNGERSEVIPTCAEINSWLPGDNLYDDAIFVPQDMPAGIYQLQIGIVDRQSHTPKVNLAIEGRDTEGWYSVGKLEIK